jgi:hypothetical protein
VSRARLTQDILEYLATTDDGDARLAQDCVEVLQAYTVGATPTGSFGAALSQDCVEVLQSGWGLSRTTGFVIELLIVDAEASGSTGGPVAYGAAN